jgi:hypothetical protein
VVRIHAGGHKPFVLEELQIQKTLLALCGKLVPRLASGFGKGTALNSD